MRNRKILVFFVGWVCVALSITCLFGGFYLSIWSFFIGGIINMVDAIKAPETNSTLLATGIAKLVFCWVPSVIGLIVTALFGSMANECLKDF